MRIERCGKTDAHLDGGEFSGHPDSSKYEPDGQPQDGANHEFAGQRPR
jgi:hypothetical protein